MNGRAARNDKLRVNKQHGLAGGGLSATDPATDPDSGPDPDPDVLGLLQDR